MRAKSFTLLSKAFIFDLFMQCVQLQVSLCSFVSVWSLGRAQTWLMLHCLGLEECLSCLIHPEEADTLEQASQQVVQLDRASRKQKPHFHLSKEGRVSGIFVLDLKNVPSKHRLLQRLLPFKRNVLLKSARSLLSPMRKEMNESRQQILRLLSPEITQNFSSWCIALVCT